MNQPSKIPLLRERNGEVLQGNPFSSVVLSSARTNWQNIVVEEHRFASHALEDLMYIQHVIGVNLGPLIDCEFKKCGRFQRMSKTKGTIYLSPSHTSFNVARHPSMEENGFADVLYVALDPVLLTRTAEALEIYPDRVELVEQQRSTDPALVHISLALRAGIGAWRAGDSFYGESMASALAVHLLREYGRQSVEPQHTHVGLSREMLKRAIEYIQEQLETNLTVSEIARTVHMSPHHFTLRFKQSTGQSPYRYVIEARARKAKELLTSGRFSISEIAHQVGFADQSHLARHIKRLFGITPRMLVKKQYEEQTSSKQTDESSRPLPI
jgi:AraC family transcriptional regulator